MKEYKRKGLTFWNEEKWEKVFVPDVMEKDLTVEWGTLVVSPGCYIQKTIESDLKVGIKKYKRVFPDIVWVRDITLYRVKCWHQTSGSPLLINKYSLISKDPVNFFNKYEYFVGLNNLIRDYKPALTFLGKVFLYTYGYPVDMEELEEYIEENYEEVSKKASEIQQGKFISAGTLVRALPTLIKSTK